MKKTFATILSLGITVSGALAAEGVITAVKVSDINNATVWENAKFSSVTLYPQTAIEFNDKKANELTEKMKAKKASVAAIYDGKEIALMIKWADKTKDVEQCMSSDVYTDGFAVQFVGKTAKPQPLPYIGMGSVGRPVVVHLQKATAKVYEPNGNKDIDHQINRQQTDVFNKELADFDTKVASLADTDYERVFVGEGFRSLTEVKDGSVKSNGSMVHGSSGWTGTLSRPLQDEYVSLSATVPVSIAIWDGSKMGRNGLKNLSAWLAINLEGQKPNAAMVADLTTDPKGDAIKGKAVAQANGCNGCHQMTSADAKNFMAPALSNVGGYSTGSYLRESIVNPSAAIVPGYNRNAHPNTPWYTLEKGKRVSTMTNYNHLSKKEVEDVVAYLKTLKAEVE